MEDNKLALELLHEVKKTSKRYFILFIVTLILMCISNALWLYAWCLPVEETTTTSTISKTYMPEDTAEHWEHCLHRYADKSAKIKVMLSM